MVYDPAIGRLVAAPDVSTWTVLRMRSLDSEDDIYVAFDADREITVTGTGTTVTAPAAGFSPYTPRVGDVLYQSLASKGRITALSLNAGTYTITLSSALTSSGATSWRQGYDCVVEWAPQHAAGLNHRWQEMHLEFSYMRARILSWPVEVGGYSHRDSSATMLTHTVTDDPSVDPIRRIVRVGLPRNVVRTPYFVPRFRVNCADAFWRLEHVYLHHTTGSRRTAR